MIMSTNTLRLGALLFIAVTLGFCRMLPFPRYSNYPLNEDGNDQVSNSNDLFKISTQQSPDSNSNPPPRIEYHDADSGTDSGLQQSDHSTGAPELTISLIPDQNNPTKQPPHLSTPSLELLHARRALKKLKYLLGPARLRALLQDEIHQGNQAWHHILSSSSYPFDTGSQTHPDEKKPEPNLKLSQVHLLATQPCQSSLSINYTSASFLSWFLTNAFTPSSPQLWAGHPEHYGINLSPNTDGTLRGEILEPWGPLMTDSYVGRFVPVPPDQINPSHNSPSPNPKKPWMHPRPEYPLQMVGDETLMDGSEKIIANLHYSYRDIPADEGCHGSDPDMPAEEQNKKRGSGIEAIFAMWMPDATPDDVVQGLSEHLEVEYYNWLRWAYEDIKSGAFKPT